jgi:hypothetical protein
MTAKDLDELEGFFNAATIPETMQLSKGVLMHNVPAQIKHYLELLRTDKPGLYTTEPRYQDLIRIREILTEKAG